MSEEQHKHIEEKIEKAEDHSSFDSIYDDRRKEGNIEQRQRSIDFNDTVKKIVDILPQEDEDYESIRLKERTIELSDPLNIHLQRFGFRITYELNGVNKDGDYLVKVVTEGFVGKSTEYFWVSKVEEERDESFGENGKPAVVRSFSKLRRKIMNNILDFYKYRGKEIRDILEDDSEGNIL